MKNDIMIKRICKELENDFPIEERPYKALAERLGYAEKDFIDAVKRCKRAGLIKKIGISLDYRRLGIRANAMAVWVVSPGKVAAAGKAISSFTEVTHCYQRKTQRHWPYNLFTMIHAKTKGRCEEIAKRISLTTGISRYQLIYSTKELKKKRMNYFSEKT